ncbi:helix-turn-helix domain-containing protein [Saccharopolyspora sp. NPDC050389]|uniref:TetR/AcrR family transcriptional regulator n=1 Tax=Saccharopolyspora sp. NPDC050389 TaxID=3155516 RepID=UPI0033C10917
MGDRSARTRQAEKEATEATLQEAALRLLERDGILAGLNLREVAEEAQVSRALVYHHFRSRRQLLRLALRRNIRERTEQILTGSKLPLVRRFTRYFRVILGYRQEVRMKTLLVLDEDKDIVTMPLRESAVRHLTADVEQGRLDVDDVEALHLALMAMINGYLVYRDHFAAEVSTPAEDLDRRIEAIIQQMLSGLAPKDAPSR